MNLSLTLVLILNLSLGSFACQVKKSDSSSDSFVCVCNEFFCDTLDTGPFSTPETLTIFKSDAAYYRLTKVTIPESSVKTAINQTAADLIVSIDSTKKFQSITGFGGSFTDAAGLNINKLKPALQDRLIADYFGSDGSEYNLARVPMAGTDFSIHVYSYDDVVNDFELVNFSLTEDDYEYKIPHIKNALDLSENLRLFASPWAPPAWLKTNNASNGLGILIGEPGSLHWQTWANYFVKFFESYKQSGIEFWGLTPQNEPLTGLMPEYRFNTLGFSSYMMRDFIKKNLGPTLNANGYGSDKIKLLIYDHNTDEIYSFARGVLNDPEAAAYVSGVAYHWYDGLYTENLDAVHNNYPEYFLLSTEACQGFGPSDYPGAGVSFGNWTRAETYASDIIGGLNHWSTGWVDWNLALDPKGSTSWVSNTADAAILIAEDGSEYYKQPMYYSLAHFSKFLKPQSVRVAHSISQNKVEGVELTTFVTPSNDLVIVVLNTNEKMINMAFLEVAGNSKFTLNIEARSIHTIIKPL